MLSIVKSTWLCVTRINPQTVISSFHSLSLQKAILPASSFLAPKLQNVVQTCGLKIKGRVKRRCKDCYFVMREGRLYVECKAFGRHRQVTIAKKPINTWILTHATQSKVRPW